MSTSGDDHSQKPPAKADSIEPPSDDKRSGRIAYDERGTSVWEWQLETGVYSRDISTSRLKKLNLNDLSIADTATHKRPPSPGKAPAPEKQTLPGDFNLDELSLADTATHQRPPNPGEAPAPANKPLAGGGFNPYDNSSTAAGKVASQPYNSGEHAAHKAEPSAPRKPMDLKKLQEWIEIRKRVQENKRDEEE
jgi:hypothetical protein